MFTQSDCKDIRLRKFGFAEKTQTPSLCKIVRLFLVFFCFSNDKLEVIEIIYFFTDPFFFTSKK